MVLPEPAIVPTEALPFAMPSTNHRRVPVPPDKVAVNACGCEVVTAERCGERVTVTLEPGGFGGGRVEELPPPQEVSPGENSAAAVANISVRRPLLRSGKKRPRSTMHSIEESPLVMAWAQ